MRDFMADCILRPGVMARLVMAVRDFLPPDEADELSSVYRQAFSTTDPAVWESFAATLSRHCPAAGAEAASYARELAAFRGEVSP